MVLEHYEDMLALYGTVNGVRVARKHIGWYSTGLRGGAEFRHKVNQQNDPEIEKQIISDFYDETEDAAHDRPID